MTCPNDTNDKSEPSLRLILPGVLTPSLNVMNKLHWSRKAEVRRAWSTLIGRCLLGLQGTAVGPLTRTILPGVANSYAMQSLPPSVVKVIQRKKDLHGNTCKKAAIFIEVWEL